MQGKAPRVEEILQVFEADWFAQNIEPLDFHPGESKESLEAKARAMITLYVEAQAGSVPAAVEEPFEMELADPETGEVLGVPLRGIVDLIETDGTLVDLKTAARTISPDDLERHLQLSTYALVVFLKTGKIPKLRLDVLLKTRQPRLERHATSRTVQDLAWVAHLIQSAVVAIEQGNFYPNPSWRCSECEYFAHCQAWRGREHQRFQGRLVPIESPSQQ